MRHLTHLVCNQFAMYSGDNSSSRTCSSKVISRINQGTQNTHKCSFNFGATDADRAEDVVETDSGTEAIRIRKPGN